MFDWDRLTENDPVATAVIPISQISSAGNDGEDAGGESTDPSVDTAVATAAISGGSAQSTFDVAAPLPPLRASGAGFLPTFGPAFVNFYGAPREFKEINLEEDLEHLNLGLGRFFCTYLIRFSYLLLLGWNASGHVG